MGVPDFMALSIILISIFTAALYPSMAQTNKDRQESLRARRAMLGMTEVRGIYLPPKLHAELKRLARELLERSQRNPNRPAGL